MANEHLQLHRLPLGAVRPRGWLREQALIDLDEGFLGCLDRLTGRARADPFAERYPADAPADCWWDAETRGNWLWGYAMTAYLVAHAAHLPRVDRLLDALRDTQDPDGYVGIYGPGNRFRHPEGENGELWAQSRALLPLLARHEFTGNAGDLQAVERAVALTARHYGDARSYFRAAGTQRRSGLTGLTHGLCYADVLEQLHTITGNPAYAGFGAWLYDDFSRQRSAFPNDDLALPNLLEPDRPWSGHAVHTAAHLRVLLFAHGITARPDLATGVRYALGKLRAYALPAGALPGDEAVHGVPLPDSAYELCTTVELGLSLATALQRTGLAALGDWAEAVFFNGVQGARLADARAVSYLSADTRLAAVAGRSDAYSIGRAGRRFKFSPTHDDVACCCAPNAGRALPHYVSRMWMGVSNEPGLAFGCYGPSSVSTPVAGVPVTIVAETGYPFAEEIEIKVAAASPVAFALFLRKPAWAGQVGVRATGADVTESSDWCRVHRTWTSEAVSVTIRAHTRALPYANGEFALMHGPLQFVVPLEPRFEPIRDYEVAGFHDFDVRPRDPEQACRVPLLDAGAPNLGAEVLQSGSEVRRPWASPPLRLRVGSSRLVPMGAALLRRAAFPLRPA